MTRTLVTPSSLSRRAALKAGLAGAAALTGLARLAQSPARAQGAEIRIGYQKGSANLLVLKSRGLLDDALRDSGVTVTWTEFPAGVVLLEALNAGSIDFGTTGAPPPIFAQAAGADLIYASAATPSPLEEGILVPQDSAIQEIADLAGRKVAVAKGSSANAPLVRALESAGLNGVMPSRRSCCRLTPKPHSRVAASMPGRLGIPTTRRKRPPAKPGPSPPTAA